MQTDWPIDVDVPGSADGEAGPGRGIWREPSETARAFHPLADAFPLIEGAEFAELVGDVRVNGVREPVVLFEDMILDGRNRWRAAREVRIDVPFVDFDGTDPVGFVISANLRRRHMDESQRALVAARFANLTHGGDRRSDQAANLPLETVSPDAGGDGPPDQAANLPLETTQPPDPSHGWRERPGGFGIVPITQDHAAELLNVSPRLVRAAKKVQTDGAPELTRAVEQGHVAVSAAADVAGLPRDEQQELVARGEKAILEAAKQIRAGKAEARRAERMERIIGIAAGNGPLPTDCTYPLIYADPPWRYVMGDTDRSVENHYPTMSLDEICALPVDRLATRDAVLFLWIPEPHLYCSGVPVLQAWGFTHKSGFVWDKQRIGMGHYNRVVHEHLLICTRGAVPEPRPAARPPSLYSERRSDTHSEKPQRFYEFIEAMYPEFVRLPPSPPLMIELFARSGRPGWASWGNQAPADAATGEQAA